MSADKQTVTHECLFYQKTGSNSCQDYTNCRERCDQTENVFCVSMFENKSGIITPSWAGCYTQSSSFCPREEVTRDSCHLKYYKVVSGGHHTVCCCKGDMCNLNNVFNETLMIPPITTTTTTTLQTVPPPKKVNPLYYSIPPIICMFSLVFFFVFLYKRHKRRMRKVNEPLFNASPPTPVSTRPVKWRHIVSHGQFGCVWRATYEGNDAAVKIIQAQEKSSWITEKTMYQNYSLVHENILKFYSAEKRLSDGGMVQYWIVTQYHSNGSLSDYLRANILDWDGMLRLMISMTKGLTFLHTENFSSNPVKPIISHRDFKSRNVLVKDDLTCCISDFGSACQFKDLRENEDTKAQVGTKRYMAPEVLDGAIAFQTYAFLNIDTYALGLVLWEVLSRCSTPKVIVNSPYKRPFEEEVGLDPTLDEMRTCVVDNKRRPLIRPAWRRSRDMAELCDTIVECWDTEPDARLHAHCVMERLMKIQRGEFNDNDNQSDASSGFGESSFIHDQVVELSQELSQEFQKDESSISSAAKEPLIVELPV